MIRNIMGTALIATAIFTAPALAQERTEVGVLNCNVAGGVGFVFGSTKQLACAFETADGRVENYVGQIRKFGIDVGATSGGAIVWGVLAPTQELSPWTLAGTYGGVSAEATAGIGAGANAMIGGSQNTIVLQPVSVSGQTGLNVAAGISEIELVPAS